MCEGSCPVWCWCRAGFSVCGLESLPTPQVPQQDVQPGSLVGQGMVALRAVWLLAQTLQICLNPLCLPGGSSGSVPPTHLDRELDWRYLSGTQGPSDKCMSKANSPKQAWSLVLLEWGLWCIPGRVGSTPPRSWTSWAGCLHTERNGHSLTPPQTETIGSGKMHCGHLGQGETSPDQEAQLFTSVS